MSVGAAAHGRERGLAGQDIKGVETAKVGLRPVGKGRRQKRASL